MPISLLLRIIIFIICLCKINSINGQNFSVLSGINYYEGNRRLSDDYDLKGQIGYCVSFEFIDSRKIIYGINYDYKRHFYVSNIIIKEARADLNFYALPFRLIMKDNQKFKLFYLAGLQINLMFNDSFEYEDTRDKVGVSILNRLNASFRLTEFTRLNFFLTPAILLTNYQKDGSLGRINFGGRLQTGVSFKF